MQKVKHLEFEYNKSLREHEVQKAVDDRDMCENHLAEQNSLMDKIKDHEFSIGQMSLHYEDLIRQLKLKQDQEVHGNQLLHEKKLVSTIIKYEKMMLDLEDAMDLQKRSEIHEIEDSKNSDIKSFMDTHNQDFQRMQGYFKDITLKNLALIANLKDEIEAVKRNEEDMKSRLSKVFKENVSLHRVRYEVELLKRNLTNYERDKVSLSLARKRLDECSDKAKVLEFENEVLSQKLVSTEKQKESLHNQFVSLLRNIQDRTGLKGVFLENKLKVLEQGSESGSSSSGGTQPCENQLLLSGTSKVKETAKVVVDRQKPMPPNTDKEQVPVNVINVQFPTGDRDVHFNPPNNLNEPGVDVRKL